MTKFYSASTGGFYSSEIHGNDMPGDAVGISDGVWQKMCDGQAEGKIIIADAGGKPTLAEPPGPTKDEQIATAEDEKNVLRANADHIIQPLKDADELGIATDSEKVRLNQWKTYRVMLNRVATSTAPDITWPEKPAS